MVEYLHIIIKNKHVVMKTVNDSNMYSIPFDNLKIIDENDRILVNRKKKENLNDFKDS